MRTFSLSFIVVVLPVAGCGQWPPPRADVAPEATATAAPATTPDAAASASPEKSPARTDGLVIEDISVGYGRSVWAGDHVKMLYTGMLKDGTVFDSTRSRNDVPLEVAIGRGRVIKGWDLGVPGMRVGGKRRLVIPPELAYGDEGRPNIPPKSTLIFEVELVDIVEGKHTP